MLKDEGVAAGESAAPDANKFLLKTGSSWLKWSLLAAVLTALVVVNFRHVWPLMTRYGARGAADFFTFYAACQVLYHGLASQLYDVAVLGRFESPYYQMRPLPYNHPAYELLAFLPFASLPTATAFWAWNALNLLLLGGSAWLLARRLKGFPGSGAAWIFLGALAFFPVVLTLMQGQDSILVLCIFTLVYMSLRGKREALAGTILAAGSFKFPMILPFLVPWVLRGRWRFVSGFAAGAAVMAAVSVAMVGLQGTRQYIEMLLSQIHNPETAYIDPRWMPTTRGLLAVLFPGAAPRTVALAGGLVALLLVALATLRFVGEAEGSRFDLWFGMNIVAAVLASPHLYGHDLAVAFLALLLANHAIAAFAVRGVRIACRITSAVLFCTPFYLRLQNADRLGLLSLPLFLLLLLLAFALQSVQWDQKNA